MLDGAGGPTEGATGSTVASDGEGDSDSVRAAAIAVFAGGAVAVGWLALRASGRIPFVPFATLGLRVVP